VWHWFYNDLDINDFIEKRREAFEAVALLPPSTKDRSSMPLWTASTGWGDADADWSSTAKTICRAHEAVGWSARGLRRFVSEAAGPLAERNNGLHVVGAQSFAQPAGIKSLIADQGQAIDAGHESVEAGDVVPLARQEHEADQIAERIDDHRDLRRQAAARFADGLILSPPFAPVPC
jgi:hypothetical protein